MMHRPMLLKRMEEMHFLYVLSADVVQAALVAVRFCPCGTYGASVIDKSVAEIVAFLRRDDLPERHLDFFRVFFVNKSDPVAQTDAVCVRNDRRFAEHIAHDQIGAFASDTRESEQRIKIIRYFGIIHIAQHAHAAADVFGFAFAESARTNDLFNFLDWSIG